MLDSNQPDATPALMRATNWEFKNRAMAFGLIIFGAFGLYLIDHANATALLATWLGNRLHIDDGLLARILFALAALLLALAALIRTWASAYLNSGVVYASEVKSDSLVADGPYRYVRNPLYFANVLMAIAIGTAMSRIGMAFLVAVMILFCYRLIFREEGELQAGQNERYDAYRQAVPRMFPALTARLPSTGRPPDWRAGFRSEAWYWGFSLSLFAFAVTLQTAAFLLAIALSLGLLWISSSRRSGR